MASKIIVDQLEKTGGTLTALTLPSANATANQYLQDNGSGALSWTTVTAGFNSVIVYTVTGAHNWVKSSRPAGITKIVVELQGGGGGGAMHVSLDTYNECGAGGGYAKKFIDVSSVTQAVLNVGTGGAGSPSNSAGGDGTSSTYLDTAFGGSSDVKGLLGKGGPYAANTNMAVGGLGTGGDINIQGQYGGTGYHSTSSGGDSQLGRGGRGGNAGRNQPSIATGYGSGGGGGMNVAATDGMPGIIIIWEYL
jgi:hypothetical protein